MELEYAITLAYKGNRYVKVVYASCLNKAILEAKRYVAEREKLGERGLEFVSWYLT